MRIALEIVLPLFALILCGYVFARKGMLSAEGVKGINAFVFYFADAPTLMKLIKMGAKVQQFVRKGEA